MFDEEVLSALIAAEHHTINHKLDLCFVVMPFVTSSEKFRISSIWKIVYFVYCVRTFIVVSWYCDAQWSRSHSYQSYYRLPFVQIMIWRTVHRSSFIVQSNHNVWRLEMWTVNHQPGTMGPWKSFSKDVRHIVEHETNQILLMYAKFKSHFICDIRYCVWDDSFLFIHKIWPTYLCIHVFIMIDHDNVAINSILKFSTYWQWHFWFVVRSIKRFHLISDHPLAFHFGNSICPHKSIVILDKQIYKCTRNVFRLVRSDNFQKSVQNTIKRIKTQIQ